MEIATHENSLRTQVRAVMDSRGISLRTVGIESGVSVSTLSRWMRGYQTRMCTIKKIEDWACIELEDTTGSVQRVVLEITNLGLGKEKTELIVNVFMTTLRGIESV